MNIFKRKRRISDTEMSDEEKIIAANKRIQKLESKKTISGYHYTFNGWRPKYKDNRKNRNIDREINIEKLKIELAEENRLTPQPAPRKVTYDYSKHTTVDISPTVNINSGNKKGLLVDSLNDSGNNSGNKPSAKNNRKQSPSSTTDEPSNKSNAKTIIFLVVFGLVLVCVAALSVYLSTCIGNKSAYSTAAAIFASTSE